MLGKIAPEVTALVRTRGTWVHARSRPVPDDPAMDDAHVTAADVLRSGRFDSLGAALGFTREDMVQHRNYARVKWHSVQSREMTAAQPGERPDEATTEKMREVGAWHDSMADRLERLLQSESN